MARLEALDWPGNVRELRNTVERLLILSPGDGVRPEDVDALVSGTASADALGNALLNVEVFSEFKERAEMAFIEHKLRINDWKVSETARQIDMPRSNLYKKIEKYGLNRTD
jgi:two-component system nitrogen regulation response regulator NtrX